MTDLKTVSMMDAQDLATECEMLVQEHLERRGFTITGLRSYAQVLAGSRYGINVHVDTEKFRRLQKEITES